jgi:hypothetical protein
VLVLLLVSPEGCSEKKLSLFLANDVQQFIPDRIVKDTYVNR